MKPVGMCRKASMARVDAPTLECRVIWGLKLLAPVVYLFFTNQLERTACDGMFTHHCDYDTTLDAGS